MFSMSLLLKLESPRESLQALLEMQVLKAPSVRGGAADAAVCQLHGVPCESHSQRPA